MHDFRVVRDQVDALRSAMRRRGKLETLAPVIDRGVALDVEPVSYTHLTLPTNREV